MKTLSETEEKLARRQDLLEKLFEDLRVHIGEDFQYLRLNHVILYNVVVSYFDDVERCKSYHRIKLINEVKQAGFLIKWICRLRPVEFEREFSDVSTNLLLANEIYAVRTGLVFMKINPNELPRELYANVLYTLRYRSIDEGMLFIWLETLSLAFGLPTEK